MVIAVSNGVSQRVKVLWQKKATKVFPLAHLIGNGNTIQQIYLKLLNNKFR